MPQLKPICTDPSHPPIIGTLTQETLYEEVVGVNCQPPTSGRIERRDNPLGVG